jgi:hypothetical protein
VLIVQAGIARESVEQSVDVAKATPVLHQIEEVAVVQISARGTPPVSRLMGRTPFRRRAGVSKVFEITAGSEQIYATVIDISRR